MLISISITTQASVKQGHVEEDLFLSDYRCSTQHLVFLHKQNTQGLIYLFIVDISIACIAISQKNEANYHFDDLLAFGSSVWSAFQK